VSVGCAVGMSVAVAVASEIAVVTVGQPWRRRRSEALRLVATTCGIERSIDKGADEGMEAPRLARADLGLKGGGHKGRMIAELDRLASGVRRTRAHCHTLLGEERDILLR